jgi:type II secretory pathway pseudopilin PulG
MITVMLIGILLAIAVPNWVQSRTRTNARACQKQLQTIRSAKENYVMSRNLPVTTTLTMNDLVTDGWLRPGLLCPHGFTYVIGAVNEDPTCPSGMPGHVVESP